MEKLCRFLDVSQIKVFQFYQAKYIPEQGLIGKAVKVSTKDIQIFTPLHIT